MAETFTCKVCGYPDMVLSPEDWNICPCCGTEFELDDDEVTNAELRELWVTTGAQWWSSATPAPANWNPHGQLKAAGFAD